MSKLWWSTFAPSILLPFIAFLIVDGFLLLTDQRWIGSLRWSVDWANGGLFLGACVLAPVCVITTRTYIKAFRPLLRGARDWAFARLALTLTFRNFLIAFVLHALVVIAAIGRTLVAGPSDSLDVAPLIYSVMPIAVFTVLGTLIAAYSPSLLAVLPAIGLAYGASFAAATTQLTLPTPVGGSFVTLAGLQYPIQSVVASLLLSLVICTVMIVGSTLVLSARSGRLATVLLVASLAIGLVGPSFVLTSLPERLSVVTNTPLQDYKCAGSAPKVCVLPEDAANLQTVSDAVTEAAVPLKQAGISLLSTVLYEQLPGDVPSARGVLLLASSNLNLHDFSAREYATALTRPANCAAYASGREGVELLNDADRLAIYLSPSKDQRPTYSENASWAARTFQRLQTCARR